MQARSTYYVLVATPGSQLQESPDLQKITFFCMGEVDEVRGTQLYFFI